MWGAGLQRQLRLLMRRALWTQLETLNWMHLELMFGFQIISSSTCSGHHNGLMNHKSVELLYKTVIKYPKSINVEHSLVLVHFALFRIKRLWKFA